MFGNPQTIVNSGKDTLASQGKGWGDSSLAMDQNSVFSGLNLQLWCSSQIFESALEKLQVYFGHRELCTWYFDVFRTGSIFQRTFHLPKDLDKSTLPVHSSCSLPSALLAILMHRRCSTYLWFVHSHLLSFASCSLSSGSYSLSTALLIHRRCFVIDLFADFELCHWFLHWSLKN